LRHPALYVDTYRFQQKSSSKGRELPLSGIATNNVCIRCCFSLTAALKTLGRRYALLSKDLSREMWKESPL
jgi:hypothetical protein